MNERDFAWKDSPRKTYKNVVVGDVVWLTDNIMDKMYSLFGISEKEVEKYFKDKFKACTDMALGRHSDNKFTSAFKKATGKEGEELMEDFKRITGCLGLSNPQLFNLRLPDQFMVYEVTDNTFKIKFIDVTLKNQWSKQKNSHLVKSFVDSLELEIGSDDYFVMRNSF